MKNKYNKIVDGSDCVNEREAQKQVMCLLVSCYPIFLVQDKRSAVSRCAQVLGVSSNAVRDMLKKPDVAAAIKQHIEKDIAKYRGQADDVLHELSSVANVNMADYFTDEGKLIEVKGNREKFKAVKRLNIKEMVVRDKLSGAEIGLERHITIELWDKVHALDTLAQVHKLIKSADSPATGVQGQGPQVHVYLPDNGYRCNGLVEVKPVRFSTTTPIADSPAESESAE